MGECVYLINGTLPSCDGQCISRCHALNSNLQTRSIWFNRSSRVQRAQPFSTWCFSHRSQHIGCCLRCVQLWMWIVASIDLLQPVQRIYSILESTHLNNISQLYTKQMIYDLELYVRLNTQTLFRCLLDVFCNDCKIACLWMQTLAPNNVVLFTVCSCTNLIHWLLHLFCRNWGLPSWQNWFREGSQRANDTWNDYYEKEIKCPNRSEASLFPTCSAALCQCLRAGRKAKAGKTSTPRATSGS